MGRLKMEKEFKEKLDRREIKPSENSWDKLSAQLDIEERSSKINFWWLSIAATVIAGIIIVGLQYRNTENATFPGVVDVPVKEVNIDKKENTNANIISKKEEVLPVVENSNSRVAVEVQKESLNNNTPKAEFKKALEPDKIVSFKEKPAAVASLMEPKGVKQEKELAVYPSSDELITQKLNEVIAQVNSMNSKGNSVSEAEVDRLLEKAAHQIKLERDYNFSVGKINPEELLESVEMDIEYSFREKIFEVLKDGYLKARTAVANRNY